MPDDRNTRVPELLRWLGLPVVGPTTARWHPSHRPARQEIVEQTRAAIPSGRGAVCRNGILLRNARSA
ncbi:MAG: hypothetical protein H6837_08180 [Planctomycetes bacterium]|nr:hypothetical protein [Planctomycetota bacterium]